MMLQFGSVYSAAIPVEPSWWSQCKYYLLLLLSTKRLTRDQDTAHCGSFSTKVGRPFEYECNTEQMNLPKPEDPSKPQNHTSTSASGRSDSSSSSGSLLWSSGRLSRTADDHFIFNTSRFLPSEVTERVVRSTRSHRTAIQC